MIALFKPNKTLDSKRLVPNIVTCVLPDVKPITGETLVIVGVPL